MNLSLDADQENLLRQVLDSTYRDLKYETADTDNSSFKSELRDRGRQLRSILDLVGGPLPDPRSGRETLARRPIGGTP